MNESLPRDIALDEEGAGQSFGIPAQGAADVGALEPLGTSGLRHWRESTITDPGLDDRGNVFFAAVEMTRMPMILSDPNLPDTPIVFANKAFLDLTGYENEEVLGRNCRFLQGARTDREAVAEMREAIAAKQSIAIELLNYRRDGSPFWNAVFIGPVYDTSGKLLYYVASQLDVSRRREAEQSHQQAQKMEAIGQLTAGMAHDFNNLLQVVNGNLELLASQSLDERGRRYLSRAQGAAERGAKLTGQLLAFARKSRLVPKPIDAGVLINDFADMMESSTGGQVELQLNLRRGLPLIVVDPEQLELSLLNIVVNARDAMPNGGVVTITTRAEHLSGGTARELSSGDYVVIEVRDEGQGMPPHVLARAREPFFTTKGTGKGTGLGLAMATGFAQQSRGRLEIDSELGRGTTIRFLFPATRDLPAQDAERTPKVAKRDDVIAGERVLVVEDSDDVLELATEILTSVGYRVTTAISGDDALTVFDREHKDAPFDLLFTDLVMPGGMDGMMLADRIVRLAPEIGVLMTTGYNEDLVGDGHARTGADILGKPYRRSELLDRVRQALNGRGRYADRRRASEFGAIEE